ncbi:hypothetical protein JCM24511_07544 [Saitozyma sp. JCM 24511]|nr:hypothetical protein JCM24511_07544 [Saitozyma sp. JCM 24511]
MSHLPKHRQLPDKESKLFKELLTQYELKGYKKGLKAADTILKKFPNHGETLALKALTLYSSLPSPLTVSTAPKQDEAEAMARLAVKKDITSHITWHVLGILAKSRKDWDEASRAFAMARKQDNDNIPLIRDSISLYLHTRQYSQAVSARHHYLLLRPQIRSSWLGLVVAHHLNGDTDEALRAYDGFAECTQTDGATGPEKSQVCLYIVKLCMEGGKHEEALRRLEKGLADKVISPRGEASQLRAELLFTLGRREEAEDAYRALLEQNPDNLEYYRGFLRTKGLDITVPLDQDATSRVLAQLSTFAESYPRSSAPRRLALDIAQGETFRSLARDYLVNGLEKGVPSLFVDVKGVYPDASKMSVVGEVVEDIISNLQKDVSLHADDSLAPPTTLLWAYYYLALHLAHPLNPSPAFKRALDLLSIALEHTPTLPEIHMAKAMVLKRAGDVQGAAEAMEEARLLDGQDRFLNGKAAKYWLRAGDVKKAEELVAMFTKKDMTAVADLTDLQCLWFLQEEGDAYRRNGNLAMALKRYQALVNVFQDYEDDQYDFHTYCMRRMTLAAYVSSVLHRIAGSVATVLTLARLMRYEDQLRSHPGYYNGALAAIGVYLKLSDKPDLKEEKLTPEEEAERKKAAKKAQKADQKAKKAAAAASDGKKEDPPVPDADPMGQQLLKTETPLEDALKLWKPLETHAAARIETWLAGYEIQIRRKLYLAALQCLQESAAIDGEHPDLHRQILHFHRTVRMRMLIVAVSVATDLPSAVKSTIEATLPSLLPTGTSPADFNASFLSRHSSSSAHILGAAAGLLEIKRASDPLPSNTSAEILAVLDKLFSEGVSPSIEVLQKGRSVLEEAGADKAELEAWRERCRTKLPLAWVFASKEEVEARKASEGPVPNGTVKADV